MIYTNERLRATDVEMEWGNLHQIALGEKGRGRKLMTLPCPLDIEEITKGLHADLTIGLTKSNRVRINHGHDDKLYMILSSQGGYTRRGCGTIQIPEMDVNRFNVLIRGNGADGAAGRIGYWDCMVIEAPLTDAIVRVRTSGAGYGTPSDLYIIHECGIYHCTIDTLPECCDTLGIDIPDTFVRDRGGLSFGDGWIIL